MEWATQLNLWGTSPQKCAEFLHPLPKKATAPLFSKGKRPVFLGCCLPGMPTLQSVFDLTSFTELGPEFGKSFRADTKLPKHLAVLLISQMLDL